MNEASPSTALRTSRPVVPSAHRPLAGRVARNVGFWTGFKMFLLGASVMGTASKLGRLEFGEMLFPLSLLYVLILFPSVVSRLVLLPGRVGAVFLTFVLWTFFSAARTDGWMTEMLKLGAFVFTIIVVASLVRSREHVIAGALGMAVPAAGISVLSVMTGLDPQNVDSALDALGNRNALSLFTLPALLLGAWLAFDQGVSRKTRWVMMASSLTIAVVLFARSNRSGWLGVGIVILMVLARRASMARYFKLIVVGALAFGVLQATFTSEVFKERVDEMVEGRTADKLRGQIFIESFKIALENPILGIGPQVLPYELSKRFVWHFETLESHNLFAGVAGGNGLLGLALLLWSGFELWRWRKRGPSGPVDEAAWLIQGMLVLFMVRGQFTRDVLFSPSFAVAFGLAIGLGIVAVGPRLRRLPTARPIRPLPMRPT